MKKAKILYIITQSQWGGAQKYVFDLATRLNGKFEVTVACGGGGKLISKLETNGVRVFRLKHMVRAINPWQDFWGFWEIYRLIKKERPDIVHTNSSKAEILGNLAAALAGGTRIIHTAHGFVFNEPMNQLKRSFYIFLEKFANKYTSLIICVSDYDRYFAVKHHVIAEEKIITIHNGIDSQLFSARVDHSVRKNRKFIVTTVANLYSTKGLPYLLKAASNLSLHYYDIEFWIIGEGRERAFLEKLIQRFHLTNVVLWGFQNNTRDFLEKSDLFVLPSVKEGFPFVILEAMAAGLPIVATSVGGVPEAVSDGENGYLVPRANSPALSDKIAILREDPKMRSHMSQNNLEKVRTQFSLDTMLEKTEKIYAENTPVVEEKKPAPKSFV